MPRISNKKKDITEELTKEMPELDLFENKCFIANELMKQFTVFSISHFLDEKDETSNAKSIKTSRLELKVDPKLFQKIELKPKRALTSQAKLLKANKELVKALNTSIDTTHDMALYYMRMYYSLRYLNKSRGLYSNKQIVKNLKPFDECSSIEDLEKAYKKLINPNNKSNDFIL